MYGNQPGKTHQTSHTVSLTAEQREALAEETSAVANVIQSHLDNDYHIESNIITQQNVTQGVIRIHSLSGQPIAFQLTPQETVLQQTDDSDTINRMEDDEIKDLAHGMIATVINVDKQTDTEFLQIGT